MELSVPTALKALSASGAALAAMSAWRRKLRGDKRALVLELEDNLRYLDLVAEDDVPLGEVIGHLSAEQYLRLARSGFNFNALKRGRIRLPSLAGSDLAAWQGKTTAELVEGIFDRLRDLQARYPHVGDRGRYRWSVRVNNIRKRTWLLLRHVGP